MTEVIFHSLEWMDFFGDLSTLLKTRPSINRVRRGELVSCNALRQLRTWQTGPAPIARSSLAGWSILTLETAFGSWGFCAAPRARGVKIGRGTREIPPVKVGTFEN